MSLLDHLFSWKTFDEGRVRFAGGIRGWDDVGHETFAVELNGRELYGEVRDRWLDSQRFELEVVSFGQTVRENVGMPMDADSPFIECLTRQESNAVRTLVGRLVESYSAEPEKPFILSTDGGAVFTGCVHFVERWVLVCDDDGRHLS